MLFNGPKQMSVDKVNFVKQFRITKLKFDASTIDPKFVQKLFWNCETNSKRRNMPVLIDFDWIIKQAQRQKGRCAYSDIPMVFEQKLDWMASLERVDETQGYTPMNTILICQEFNTPHSQWNRDMISRLRSYPIVEKTVLGKRVRG